MYRKIRLYKGLPGSGKTTSAMNLIAMNPRTDFLRINNDDLSGSITNLDREDLIAVTEKLLLFGMERDKYILLDNTNLSTVRQERYATLVAEWNAANPEKTYEIEVEDLTGVPLWMCYERNRARAKSVADSVIAEMFNHHVLPNIPKYVDIEGLPNCVVIDIDGTVARPGQRGKYNFNKYHLDTVYTDIWDHIKLLSEHRNLAKVFLTARSDDGKEQTLDWLSKNLDLKREEIILFMRDKHEQMSDYLLKEKIAKDYIIPQFNIKAWFEDRGRCVEMARHKLGIEAVYQVNQSVS